jgi:hypothetical protein
MDNQMIEVKDMNQLDLYKEWYYREIELSDKFSSKIAGHLTFITILGGAAAFLWTNYKNNTQDVLLFFLNAVTTALFILTCTFFAVAYKGRKYAFMDIKKMSETLKEIDDICSAHPNLSNDCGNRKEQILSESYRTIAIENRSYNLKKSHMHNRILFSLVIAYLFLLITTAYFYIVIM